MQAITYRVALLEPVLVTALDGDPNSAVAFDFLPGSVLRGAIIARYLRAKGLAPDQFDAAHPDERRLFFDGSTRYLNAYPLDRQDNRTLPVPQSWQRNKDDEKRILDFAAEEAEDEDEAQWKGVDERFCSLLGSEARLVHAKRQISIHTARDREYGRPRRNSGAIYRYDALAAGQSFEAAILCQSAEDAQTLVSLLEGETTMGGSRTAGYGRVRFEAAKVAGEDWREAGGELELAIDGRLIVTLLSDWLLRDGDTGQFVVDVESAHGALAARLGCPLRFRAAFLRGRTIGGFNRKWGLPLPQAQAVQMGSVFVFGAPKCSESALHDVETQGVGERRAEGFGRLAINWHGAERELEIEGPIPEPVARPLPIPSGTPDEGLARRMVERMLRQQLDRALEARANALGEHIQQPSASQLSRLRAVVRNALLQPPNEGRVRLRAYLQGLRERQTTRKQFTGDRIARRELLEWLRIRVDDGGDIWRELQVQRADMPTIGGVSAALTDAMAYEYNLRLVHEALARAAKRKRREGE